MELMKSNGIEMLSRRSITIKDYNVQDDENHQDDADRTSLKIDLSMAEQFYYEVISAFEREEVLKYFVKKFLSNFFSIYHIFPLSSKKISLKII